VGWVGSGDKSRTSVGTLKPTKIIFSFIGRIFNRRKLSYFPLAQTSQQKLCFFVVFLKIDKSYFSRWKHTVLL
jgi:hypothetical protein